MAGLSIWAKLGLNKTGFDAGLTAAGKQVNKFGADMKSTLAGAFTLAAITQFTRSTVELVSKIADMSKQLGVSAEAMQEMDYWAKQNGSSIDAIATSFTALAKARAEALADPGSKSGQAFSALGIGKLELQSNTIEQTFRRIAAVINTTDFGASELTIVAELLGKSGPQLIPAMKAGLEEAAKAAHELNLILGEGVVAEVDEVGDALERLTLQLRGPVAAAVGFIADMFGKIRDLLDMVVGGAGALAGGILGTEGGPLTKWKAGTQATADHIQEIIDKRIKDEAAAAEVPKVREKKVAEFAEKAMRVAATAPIAQTTTGFAPSSQSTGGDQFQRIGAFTGASAEQAQVALLQRNLTALEKMRDDLMRRGIKVNTTLE